MTNGNVITLNHEQAQIQNAWNNSVSNLSFFFQTDKRPPLHILFIHTNWIKYAIEFLTIHLIHCSNVDHLTFALQQKFKTHRTCHFCSRINSTLRRSFLPYKRNSPLDFEYKIFSRFHRSKLWSGGFRNDSF